MLGHFLPNPLRIISQGFFGAFISDSFKLTAALDVAKENGLAKILAEPTLATLTGQEAEFLSGGEFPVPVPQGITGAVTIEFKPYGVGYVELPSPDGGDGVIVESRLTVSDPAKIRIGMEMELVLFPFTTDDAGNDIITFAFAPVGGAS